REVGGRSMYMASPEYMASYARHLVHAGARVLGGCCGTTPAHIRAMAEGIKPLAPKHTIATTSAAASDTAAPNVVGSGAAPAGGATIFTRNSPSSPAQPVQTAPLAQRSQFGAKLASGAFIRTVEIVPPRGVDAS